MDRTKAPKCWKAATTKTKALWNMTFASEKRYIYVDTAQGLTKVWTKTWDRTLKLRSGHRSLMKCEGPWGGRGQGVSPFFSQTQVCLSHPFIPFHPRSTLIWSLLFPLSPSPINSLSFPLFALPMNYDIATNVEISGDSLSNCTWYPHTEYINFMFLSLCMQCRSILNFSKNLISIA